MTTDEIQEQREALLDNIQDIYEATLDLVECVEKYIRQEARRILTLQDFQDEELCDELRERGYKGEITKTKTIKI